MWVAGADGFRSAWCVVLHNLANDDRDEQVVSNFQSLLKLPQRSQIVAVDIPIGLPFITLAGGRTCDRLARRKVGPQRARSVFSPPGLLALTENDRAVAHRIHVAAGGIGIGAQSWGLAKKLIEVHEVVTRAHQQTFREVHPEVCFSEMAERPLQHSKRTRAGERERENILISADFPPDYVAANPIRLERVKRDDFLDACAALWTAERIAKNKAKRLPELDEESSGLDMAIWY
jgi:predicted RNase H-like nuclease